MSGRRALRGDEGSAVVEFVTVGLLLMLPLVYLVLTMGRLQAAAFAAEGTAREAGRVFVGAPSTEEGTARARTAVRLGLLDAGFDIPADEVLSLACEQSPCLQPQARVVARTEVEVVLPGVPAFLDAAIPTRVTVSAEHVATVDRFRGAES